MKLYRIDNYKEPAKDGSIEFPNIKLTYTNIDEEGIYAIDNGRYIYIYIGDRVSPTIKEDYII